MNNEEDNNQSHIIPTGKGNLAQFNSNLAHRGLDLANKLAQRKKASELVKSDLQDFQFETVKVNQKGTIIEREIKQASYFIQDLGNGVTLDMVYIPGGTFMMGTDDEEIERLVNKFIWTGSRREKPQHQVTVPSFYMSKYPITQEQWKAMAQRTDLKVKKDLRSEPSRFNSNPKSFSFSSTRGNLDLPPYGKNPTRWHRPVETVNWYQAKEFCARLSQIRGGEYRLPTEAEWEYACRAGTTTPFHFGETIISDLANYDGNYTYAEEQKGVDRKETTPVGMFPPNAFGLYDMHGNVLEWCEDNLHSDYEGAPTDGSAWIDKSNNRNTSIMRGGSWYNSPDVCRSAYRSLSTRAGDDNDVGFRVVSCFGRTS